MADLATMFPQMDINQLGPVAGMALGDMFNIAKQNALMNQRNSQQDFSLAEQLNPLKVRQAQVNLESTGAITEHQKALTNRSVWDLDQDKRLAEPKYQSELAKLLATTSENEVKQAHADLEKRLMRGDLGAKDMFKATGDMLKMYEKARLEKEQSESVARIGAQSRIDVKKAGGAGAGRIPRTLQEQYTAYLNQAEQADTPEEQLRYTQLADMVFKKMMEAGNARAPAYVVPNLQQAPNAPGTVTPTVIPPKPGQEASKEPTTAAEAARAGWKLMVDKNGNRAYVGPGGKFIEVR